MIRSLVILMFVFASISAIIFTKGNAAARLAQKPHGEKSDMIRVDKLLVPAYDQNAFHTEFELLLSKQKIQAIELKKTNLQQKLIMTGIILLLIIAGLVSYGYRLIRQSKFELSAKEEKINQQHIDLELLLADKDRLLDDNKVLMKEIHHRVKNNLHMISSLLESQSAFLENEAFMAIQKSQHRIHAISLIHQKLYVNNNVTHVSMSVYIRELVSYLRGSFISDETIVFNLDLDAIELDVTQAVPVGLIINEAITNSLKYAFRKGQQGIIEVSLKKGNANTIVLSISDNGIGFSKEFNIAGSYRTSLGISLIEGLGKNIPGEIKINSGPGTRIELVFLNDYIPPKSKIE